MKGTLPRAVLPSFGTSARLFLTGTTVGPVVDSLHNQCLLTYDFAPVSLGWPPFIANEDFFSTASDFFFCTSWAVPPLLGIAYVVLGGILPRLFEALLHRDENSIPKLSVGAKRLQRKAILAVATTALIIKLSEFLETHPHALDALPLHGSSETNNLLVMAAAAVIQWITLDGTLSALLSGIITGIGGPLSELPFVANGFWHYLPEAGDYLPLKDLATASTPLAKIAEVILGENYRDLALSSITGPCYFAVTMDAIALGRWFDSTSTTDDE